MLEFKFALLSLLLMDMVSSSALYRLSWLDD